MIRRSPIVTLCIVIVMIITSCFWRHPTLVEYSYSNYRPVHSCDSVSWIPCADSAFAEIQKIGFDTLNLSWDVLEDDTLLLFSFGPRSKGPNLTPDGRLIVHMGGAADIFYSKSDCRKLRVVRTR